ncbi:MAG: GFA family protein [Caulobacteraceae bacterium]|nr:GFA family protein [Caulobacteraceae bacterium]
MIEAACHCGAVRMEIAAAPDQVTQCHCSICRKLGVLWAYYPRDQVRIIAAPDATLAYLRGERNIAFHSCKTCGCTTHWSAVDPARKRMAVNARLMEPQVLAAAAVREIQGPEG